MDIKNIYYHGTKALIKRFDRKGGGKHGQGFYFTPDRNEAIYFAESLAGDGSHSMPRIYTVRLYVSNPFNSMSIENCSQVARYFGFEYRVPEFAGGPKEHYHCLQAQMKRRGIVDGPGSFNDRLEEAGFDCVFYDFMGHVIVFNQAKIEILSEDKV